VPDRHAREHAIVLRPRATLKRPRGHSPLRLLLASSRGLLVLDACLAAVVTGAGGLPIDKSGGKVKGMRERFFFIA
jgi:hypothetical protein